MFRIGKPKAAVLPEPLWLCPTTSFPAIIIGSAFSCISVASSKPISSRLLSNAGCRFSSLKFIVFPLQVPMHYSTMNFLLLKFFFNCFTIN